MSGDRAEPNHPAAAAAGADARGGDSTAEGRPLKGLSRCDEFIRENLARRVGRSVTADDVVGALEEGRIRRGSPECIRCDNGREPIAATIRDWCRIQRTATSYIEPGSP